MYYYQFVLLPLLLVIFSKATPFKQVVTIYCSCNIYSEHIAHFPIYLPFGLDYPIRQYSHDFNWFTHQYFPAKILPRMVFELFNNT